MSSIGWIDFSSTDRERVTGVLALLSEAGTLDELGIAQLRDAFSDSLFPGFSTIQTRAKYFVTVPQLFADYWALTPRARAGRTLETYLKDAEDRLAELLVRNHESDTREHGSPNPNGIIGRERIGKGGAARRPSSTYWTGLRKFGLVHTELSIAEFCRSAAQPRPTGHLLAESAEIDSDDDDVVKRRRLVATVPRLSTTWREDIRIDLSRAEAELLHKKISFSEPLKHSIPAQLINADLLDDDMLLTIGSFEMLSEALCHLPQISEVCRTTARHAARFSRAMLGAHLRFNYLIASNLRQTERAQELSEQFEEWRDAADDKTNGKALFHPDALDEWFAPCVAQGVRLAFNTCRFVGAWHKAMRAGEPTSKLDALVRQQAIDNKGSRSLLRRSLRQDTDWVGIRTLQYRWPQARQILIDIREGLAC
ncbi:DUF6361 family protein [Paraburkholderia nemoris]|uniref:DUF6361 family protein n=1 Tax=Paraburkholderia nemoris TaxID=2793076 RepID=UPI001AFCFA5A|nr:DUF6361 family protein [Paraburkholderia nemoris]CAE6773760.1 hypothetical protein R75777_04023 [Paraburkholderia nemoris]